MDVENSFGSLSVCGPKCSLTTSDTKHRSHDEEKCVFVGFFFHLEFLRLVVFSYL